MFLIESDHLSELRAEYMVFKKKHSSTVSQLETAVELEYAEQLDAELFELLLLAWDQRIIPYSLECLV
jgi:hypothetical protein